MAQAKNFGDGGYGRLIHGKTVDETGLLTGIADSVNNVVCGLFNPKFLSSMSKNSKCPGGSFPSNAFDSIGSFCECMRSYPNLQECYTSAAFAYELNTPGVVDVVVRLGRCCNMELVSITRRIMFRMDFIEFFLFDVFFPYSILFSAII